jgi:hypothetical protein
MTILKAAATTRQSRFWDWFGANEAALFEFERDQVRVFNQLLGSLTRVHRDLVFEFGPVNDGRREFVISAGGLRAVFPEVAKLAAAAPFLPRWKITKFRPRRYTTGRLVLGGLGVETNEVYWTAKSVGAKFGLALFMARYRPTPKSLYEQIGFLLLDQALGEFDVETKLGSIQFAPLPSPIPDALRPLEELSRLIDGVNVN